MKELRQENLRSPEYQSNAFFKIYLLIMLLQLSHFLPFTQLHPAQPLPPTFPSYSSCPWVILISSLASTFPTLFLPSPVYFPPIIYAIYSLYLSPLSPPPNPLLINLHVISISVVLFLFQLFAQFSFVLVLGVVVNNCEFAVIFTVHIF